MLSYIILALSLLAIVADANAATSTYDIFVGNTAKFKNTTTASLKAGSIKSASLTAISNSVSALDSKTTSALSAKLDKSSFNNYSTETAKKLPRFVVGMPGYETLEVAIATLGGSGAKATIEFEEDQTLSTHLSVPDGIDLVPLHSAKIKHGAYVVYYGGSTAQFPIRHIFEGTGTVAGLKESRPEWFALVPNGAAVNRAIAALSPGGTLKLLPKTYTTSDAKILAQIDGLKIEAAGIKTIIRSTQPIIMEISSPSFVSANNLTTSLQSLSIGRMLFDGVTKGSNTAIVMKGIRNSDVYELLFMNLKTGIEWRGVSMTTFRDFNYEYEGGTHVDHILFADTGNHFYRNADNIIRGFKTSAYLAQIYLKGFAAGTVNGNVADGMTNIIDGLTIEGNTFFGGDNTINLTAVSFLTIRGNKMFQPNRENLVLKDCNHVQVNNNTLSWMSDYGNPSNPAHGIYVDNSGTLNGTVPHYTNLMYFQNSPYNISDNLIEAVAGNGIYVKNAFGVSIKNNTISRPNYLAKNFTSRFLYNGIQVYNSVGGEISGNTVLGSFTTTPGARVSRDHLYDIFLDAGTTNFLVKHKSDEEVFDIGNGNTVEAADEMQLTNHSKKGLSTNLVNVDPENAGAWTNSGTIIAVNAMQSPVGGTTADRITISNTNQYVVIPTSGAMIANTSYTASIYLYSSTAKPLDLALVDGGTVTALKTVRTSARWARYEITFRTGSAPGANGFFIIGAYSNNQTDIAGEYFVWGAKIEQGGTATAYVNEVGYQAAAPTTGWHRVGDRVYNPAGTAGVAKSYLCTVSGAPGTWLNEGNF